MKKFTVIALVLSAVFWNGAVGVSEDDAEAIAAAERLKQEKAEKKGRWERVLASIRENNRDRVVNHLAVVISEIKRSADLEEAQQKKLEVGAKGAAEKAVEKWVTQLEQAEGLLDQLEAAANRQNANGNKGKKGEDAEGEGAAEMQFESSTFDQLLMQWGRQLYPQTAENEPVWKETLEATLNDDQKAAWEATKQQRTEFAQSLQVAQLVQQVDGALRLTNDQRQRIFEMLDEFDPNKKGEGAKNEPAAGVAIRGNGRIVIRAAAGVNRVIVPQQAGRNQAAPSLQSLDKKALAEFLTKPQMDRWDDLLKNPNRFNMNGRQWMGNNVQFFQGGNIQLMIDQ